MKKIIYIIILSSFLFSVNISRINISLDMPSQYNIDLSNLVNGENISNYDFDTKLGLCVAYEHMAIRGSVDESIGIFMIAYFPLPKKTSNLSFAYSILWFLLLHFGHTNRFFLRKCFYAKTKRYYS